MVVFQSTLPARGATFGGNSSQNRRFTFQSTLPARGATLTLMLSSNAARFQSTLPARGATVRFKKCCTNWQDFNPRSPHGERRRRARSGRNRAYFNPRSPHGERPAGTRKNTATCGISIHAPRTGSDAIEAADDLVEWAFQSTLPARGATTFA